VIKIGLDGIVSDYWTGLTMVTGLAMTPDGTLYALEMATGNTETEPNIRPNTGRLVRQTGPDSLEEVVTGLDFPISMTSGPDGWFYVSLPAIATDGELGGIIRVDPTLSGPVPMPTGLLAGSPCTPATPDADREPAYSPSPAGEDDAPPSGTPIDLDDHDGLAALAVEIRDYAFDPTVQTIRVGTIVTWTNVDSVPHTVTALDGSFDSGNLDPGESYVHAFDQAGSFAYACSYHPGMTGTIVVQ
jgi:plastocyanin